MARINLNLLKLDKAKGVKNCSYIGVFVYFFTMSFTFYWGNLCVYTDSFFRENDVAVTEVTSSWTLSYYNIGTALGSICSGHIAHFIGRKCTMILACVAIDSGLFLSALSVQHSVVSLHLSLGLLSGLGMGIALTTGLQHVVSFQPKNVGLVTAVITSGRHIGGACWNQVITLYINPDNLIPDLLERRQKYFTQPKVMHKVPSVFIVLGGACLCCHTIGIILMRPKVEDQFEDEQDISCHEENGEAKRIDRESQGALLGKGSPCSKNHTELPEKTDASLLENYSPVQLFKTFKFYVLWYMVCGIEYTTNAFVGFFKTYGQVWIQDDQYFAYLSTVVLVVSVLIRPGFGGLVDMWGIRFSSMIVSCTLCVVCNFWYFTPMANRWLYFIWTVIYGATIYCHFLYIVVATLKMFGSHTFSKNYGIVLFVRVPINFVAPLVIETLAQNYGWFYLFFSVGCVNALELALVMKWFPGK